MSAPTVHAGRPPPAAKRTSAAERHEQPAVGALAEHPQAERGQAEQVDGHAAAHGQAPGIRHRRLDGVVHDQLDAAVEDDDPGDDDQVQVAVGVGRRQHRVAVRPQPLLGTVGGAIEVRPPHPDGDQEGQRGGDHQARREGALGDDHAHRDDRLAQTDDHERPVALRELRHGHMLQAAQALAGQPCRARIVDRERDSSHSTTRAQPCVNAPAMSSAIPMTTVTAKPTIAARDAWPRREASM